MLFRVPLALPRAAPFRADDARDGFRSDFDALFAAGRPAALLFSVFGRFTAFADDGFAGRAVLFFAGSAFGRGAGSAAGGATRAVFAAAGGAAAAAGAPAGAGGFFGRPLRRAAFPAASIASNAAFASAISWECGDVRSRCTRSFSAW